MEIPFYMYIIRKIAFGAAVGFGVYAFFLYGRPFVEKITGMIFTDDVWLWYVIAGAIAVGLLAFLII
ncbi:MAG: hypothetical protein WCX74_01465 [Candidatus Paceibacterota bacterium]